MSAPLSLVELRLDPGALVRFAEDQGLNRREDEDLGYATHAWLTAMFGNQAPKPFRLLQDRLNRRPPQLLGFTHRSVEDLAEHAHAFASPLALRVCDLAESLLAKTMPGEWRSGRRVGFELMACPISRLVHNEDDIYRRHLRARDESGQLPESRAEVYRQWLVRQLEVAGTLEDYRLVGFRNIRLLRKSDRGRRDFLAPQALFAGTLRIENSDGFNRLLSRGIGRHRAFGYGMLLLRPAE